MDDRIGRYRIVGHLATGGMAEILLGAIDGAEGFMRPVVLKRVLPRFARKAEFRRMFIDEARIVSGIRHPNVVTVLELGEFDDALFLAMEYLDGESLDVVNKRVRQAGGELPPAVSAFIVSEAAAGLHAAHEHRNEDGELQHVVHRDVSPHNIFVAYDGSVKVIDFGIAKAVNRRTKTDTGTVKGKFAYMAPEQIDGSGVDRRTDVFALGVVLHELLTGRRLFARPNQLEIVRAVCLQPIPRPIELDERVDPALDRAVMKALERDRSVRYPSAAELKRDLALAVRELSPDALPQDELATIMRETFAERLVAKREMLKRLSSGSAITSVPALLSLDSDEVDLDDLELDDLDMPKTVPARARPPLAWMAIVAALVLALGGGAALWRASSDEPAPPAPLAAPAPPEPVIAAPPPVIEAPPRPSSITVHVETVPPGAIVRAGGEERGTSPLALTLPRGDAPVEVEVALDGYRRAVETVTPDVDQRLRVVMARERRAVRRPPARDPAPPTKAERPAIFRVP